MVFFVNILFLKDYVATRWYRAPELCGSFFSKVSCFALFVFLLSLISQLHATRLVLPWPLYVA